MRRKGTEGAQWERLGVDHVCDFDREKCRVMRCDQACSQSRHWQILNMQASRRTLETIIVLDPQDDVSNKKERQSSRRPRASVLKHSQYPHSFFSLARTNLHPILYPFRFASFQASALPGLRPLSSSRKPSRLRIHVGYSNIRTPIVKGPGGILLGMKNAVFV